MDNNKSKRVSQRDSRIFNFIPPKSSRKIRYATLLFSIKSDYLDLHLIRKQVFSLMECRMNKNKRYWIKGKNKTCLLNHTTIKLLQEWCEVRFSFLSSCSSARRNKSDRIHCCSTFHHHHNRDQVDYSSCDSFRHYQRRPEGMWCNCYRHLWRWLWLQ